MAGVVRMRARAGLLVAAGALPLLVGAAAAAGLTAGTAAADAAVRGAGAPVTGPDAAVPLDALVPGLPLPAGTADTPDEGLTPGLARVPGGGPAGPRVAPPTEAQARAAALTEFVPADDAETVHAVERDRLLRPARGFCSRHTGPYQAPIARFLRLASGSAPATPKAAKPQAAADRQAVADRQTPASCAAIRRYQRDHGIVPAIGFAGPVTWGAMRDDRLRAQLDSKALADPDLNPDPDLNSDLNLNSDAGSDLNAVHRCRAGGHRVACVDQDRQLMWVRDGDRVVFGPVRVRTGKPGARTRDGLHRVYWRHLDHVSTLYGSPMPYAQFFDSGEAFHGVYGSLYAPTGSYGGVSLRVADARGLWRVLRTGDRVDVWGRREA